MSAHPGFEWFYRASLGGVLGLGGLAILIFARNFGQTRGIVKYFADGLDPMLRQRLKLAAEARDRADQPSLTTYGRVVGVVAILCSICTFAPRVSPIAPYVTFMVGLACISLVAFVRGKGRLPKRVATLEVRQTGSSIAPYQVFASVLAALIPLIFLPDPSVRWGNVAISIALVLLVYLSVWIAGTPSRIRGQDIPAERFVDNYIRRYRAQAMLMAGSAIPAMALAVGGLQVQVHSVFDGILRVVAACILVGVSITWLLSMRKMMYRKPMLGEIEELEAS